MKHLHLTDELQEKASLFAAGALPDEEQREYQRHLEADSCMVCRDEVRELQAAMHAFALDTPAATPSVNVKVRLMEQAQGSKAASSIVPFPVSQRAPRRWLELTASFVAVAASIALVMVLNQNADLRRTLESLSSRIAELESTVTQQRVVFSVLTSPQVRVVNLAGQGGNPGASGRIFWDQSKRRWLFYVYDLPPVSKDKSYQLWFVPKTGNPVSASVFNTSGDGTASVDISVPNSIDELKAAAVTTEPAGGLPQPSGAFALLGAVQ